MNKLLVAIGGLSVVALGGIAYVASPYWATYQVATAFRSGDRDALAKDIDFPSVREGLKTQLNLMFMKKFRADPELKDNPFAGLALMAAPVMIDKMLDAYVTPDAFAAAVHAQSGQATDQRAAEKNPFGFQGFTTKYSSVDGFDILTEGPKGQMDFHMVRQGLFGWRVEHIAIPDDVFNAPTTPS